MAQHENAPELQDEPILEPPVPASPVATDNAPLRVVSVSLGSPSRDHSAHANILGRNFHIERRGTDGEIERARALIEELDGHVAAIGLGGIDLYLVAGGRRYTLRAGAKLARAAKVTPIVDGSGLKDTLERETIEYLQRENLVDFRGRKVLVTCAVDRFGVAEAVVKAGAIPTFGDLLFILGVPIPLRSLRQVRRLARLILPVACQLPFKLLYPTGAKQTEIRPTPQSTKLYNDADIIAGDFLLIRRFLPDRVDGKTIITNTVTTADIELLRERGAALLITTTPEFDGRSFGTNVMEGVFAALGARTPKQQRELLHQLNWTPRIVRF